MRRGARGAFRRAELRAGDAVTRAPYVHLSTLSIGARFRTESGRAGMLDSVSLGSARVRWAARVRKDGATDAGEENIALQTEVQKQA